MSYELRYGNELIKGGLSLKEALDLAEEKTKTAGKPLPLKLAIDCVKSWELGDAGGLMMEPTEEYIKLANAIAIMNETTSDGPESLQDLLLEYRWMKTALIENGSLEVRDGQLGRVLKVGGADRWRPICKDHELQSEEQRN